MPTALPTGGEHDLLDDRLLRVRNMDDLTTPVAKLELDVHTIHEPCPRNVVPDQYARGGCRQSDPASAAPTAIIIVTEASVLLFGMIKPIFFMLMTGSLRGDASARALSVLPEYSSCADRLTAFDTAITFHSDPTSASAAIG